MNLYQKTQNRMAQELDQCMSLMLDNCSEIHRFEEFCQRLQADGHQFEPNIDVFHMTGINYFINTGPEHAGELLLAMCKLGCNEIDDHLKQDGMHLISGPCTPDFRVTISQYYAGSATHAAGIACCAGAEA